MDYQGSKNSLVYGFLESFLPKLPEVFRPIVH
jgi:hypothetical protein